MAIEGELAMGPVQTFNFTNPTNELRVPNTAVVAPTNSALYITGAPTVPIGLLDVSN
jgi:hypothetical protein